MAKIMRRSALWILFFLSLALLAGCNLPVKTATPISRPLMLTSTPPALTLLPNQPAAATETLPAPPTATLAQATAPALLPTLAPFDRKDPAALLKAVRAALEQKDSRVFSLLAPDRLTYVNYIEGGQPVDRARLAADLGARLSASTPACDAYGTYEKTLQIWTSGWTPEWQIETLCYQDCNPVNPPYKSGRAAFFFTPDTSGAYQLGTVWLSDEKIWRDVYKVQLHACSEPYAPPAAEISCPGAPATRLNTGFSAYASTDTPTANRLRKAAGTSAEIIGLIQPGQVVQVTGGPTCANGIVWWKVTLLAGGQAGWTAEGQGGDYWLVPCSGAEGCKAP